jgi:predicted secreted protein
MNIFTGIILYMMIYWLLLFAVLPFGNKPDDTVTIGNSHGAPANPRIKQKFIATAIISAVVWLIVFFMIKFEVIDFYDIARQMSEEDKVR